jgi:PEP-CTERM motif
VKLFGPRIRFFGSILLAGVAVPASLWAANHPRSSILPEAGTLALFGSGMIGVAALIRRHFSE